MPLFTHEAVDFVVEVADFIVGQASWTCFLVSRLFDNPGRGKLTVLDFRDFPANLPEDLSSPSLTFAHAFARACHLRPPVRPCPQPKLCSLGLAEAIEHRLRLFLITSLDNAC